MDARVRAAVAAGNGLVTARALRARGIDPRRVAAMVRRGELVAVRRGVYTTAELWESWDLYAGRPLARIRAAALTMRLPLVFSHDSAGILQEVRLLRPHESAVHVTQTHVRGSRTQAEVHHHGARYEPEQVVDVAGLPTLDVARTVVDLAREHGYRDGLVAADGALHAGVPRAALRHAAAAMAGWPESLAVNAVVEDADPGAESAAETLLRELVQEVGLEPVDTQFPVLRPDGRVAWCDLRVGCHVFEADGRTKYLPVADGGLADQELERILWEERKRQRDVCGHGLGMSRVTWDEYWGHARDRCKERLLAEFRVSETRFGRELPAPLAEFAARMRGQRRRPAG